MDEPNDTLNDRIQRMKTTNILNNANILTAQTNEMVTESCPTLSQINDRLTRIEDKLDQLLSGQESIKVELWRHT
jgi:Mg2+ and Co2+ transporter CorA